jgi:flagellar biosynthetic protein FlhB
VSGEKTEKSTPKKLQKLRKDGQIIRSIELPAAVGLVVCLFLLPGALARLSEVVQVAMVTALAEPVKDVDVAKATAARMIKDAGIAMAPLVGALALASVVASAGLHRSQPNLHELAPKFRRINPKSGIKGLYSPQKLFDLLKASAKLGLLLAVAYSSWKAGYHALLAGPGTVAGLIDIVRSSTGEMLVRVTVLACVVALADAWWAKHRFDKQAKMSKEEIKEEHKGSEGNPEIKSAIKARQMKLSRSRMMAAVAGADVVLANPTHLVVALKYEPGMAAPTVVAKGAGAVADRIKAKAAEHDVPVLADKPLARAIYFAAEIGEPVPVEVYRAVAEVLAKVYSTRRSPRRSAA